jgi:Spy/CpxP family protein refolding chaperone
MKNQMGGGLALVALLALGSTALSAQEDRPERLGSRGGPDVEAIMSLRERLELTDQQIEQLDALRAEQVAQRGVRRAEVDEMRSRLRAGQIRRSEMMAFMEERRDAWRTGADDHRNRVDGILGPEQRESLEQLRTERRAFERGRRAGRREAEAGVGGPRGFDRAFERGSRGGAGFERGMRRGARRGPGGSGGLDGPEGAQESR